MVLRKKKKPEKPSYNRTEMENYQLELYRIKEQAKLLKKREEELKKKLDDFMTHTLQPDSKGHYLFTTINEKGEKIHLQKQARKSISLNQERAQEYLLKHGLDDYIIERKVIAPEVTQDQVIEVLEKYAPEYLDTVQVVEEKDMEQLVLSEKIPMDDFEKLCDIKISYAMTFIDDKKLQKEVDSHATERERKKI